MGETGFHYSGSELEAFSQADNYYGWILRTMAPRLRGRILEIGAGLGTVGERLWDRPETRELVLLEPADNLYADLARRFEGRRGVSTVQGYFGETDLGDPFDAIVLINVLEHIENDAKLILGAYEALRPGGAFLLFVPALPVLYGTLDEEFEHFRRYTRASLTAPLRAAGFRIDRLEYRHAVGVVGWFLAGRILRRRTLARWTMRAYDRFVIPWVALFESRIAPPFGQSLLAIASKPESN